MFGAEYTHLGASYYITIFEFIGSVFFILAILYWRRRTNIAVKRVSQRQGSDIERRWRNVVAVERITSIDSSGSTREKKFWRIESLIMVLMRSGHYMPVDSTDLREEFRIWV